MGRRKSRRAGLRLRAVGALFVLALLLLAAHDLRSAPGRSIAARGAIGAIDGYRAHVSPRLRKLVVCRFRPTCSAYGRESIRRNGLIVGGWRTAVRIARCGPWTPMGTVDRPR